MNSGCTMLRLAFLLLCLLALPVKAMTNVDLYKAQVVLPAGKNAEELARRQALEQVLIKVSGQRNVSKNEVIQKALAKSNQYISQFGYGEWQGKRTLVLGFNNQLIHNLLTQAQLTLWGSQRPVLLVWLAEEENYDRSIIWEQSGSTLTKQVRFSAEQRGLPVSIPVGDFDDITAISVPDLWGGFVRPIAEASSRYPSDSVLVAKVVRLAGGDVKLYWQLFNDEPTSMLTSQRLPIEGRTQGSEADAIATMMNTVSDYFAKQYAVRLGGESDEGVTITVLDVNSPEDFFHLEGVIKKLSSVANVQVNQLKGNEVTFSVSLLTNATEFQRELLLDSRIQPVQTYTDVEPVDDKEPTLLVEPGTVDGSLEAPTTEEPTDTNESAQTLYHWVS